MTKRLMTFWAWTLSALLLVAISPGRLGAQARAYMLATLVLTDTSANALVVGAASPTATSGTGGIKAGPIVGSSLATTGNISSSAGTLSASGNISSSGGSVSDSVGSMAALRAGGLSVASQAAGDVLYATSASQFARFNGSGIFKLNGASAPTVVSPASLAAMTLLTEASGTDSSAGATNLTTYALASSLTIKDVLLVVIRARNTGSAGSINLSLQNSTDTVTIVSNASSVSNTYNNAYVLISAQSTTRVMALALSDSLGTPYNGHTKSTFVTSYAGNWTLALRSGGVTAPDALEWEVAIYKIAGQ